LALQPAGALPPERQQGIDQAEDQPQADGHRREAAGVHHPSHEPALQVRQPKGVAFEGQRCEHRSVQLSAVSGQRSTAAINLQLADPTAPRELKADR
jgi:hypothetical protein